MRTETLEDKEASLVNMLHHLANEIRLVAFIKGTENVVLLGQTQTTIRQDNKTN